MSKVKKEALLAVRFHPKHLEALTAKAESNFMSVADYVRFLIRKDLEKTSDGQAA